MPAPIWETGSCTSACKWTLGSARSHQASSSGRALGLMDVFSREYFLMNFHNCRQNTLVYYCHSFLIACQALLTCKLPPSCGPALLSSFQIACFWNKDRGRTIAAQPSSLGGVQGAPWRKGELPLPSHQAVVGEYHVKLMTQTSHRKPKFLCCDSTDLGVVVLPFIVYWYSTRMPSGPLSVPPVQLSVQKVGHGARFSSWSPF